MFKIMTFIPKITEIGVRGCPELSTFNDVNKTFVGGGRVEWIWSQMYRLNVDTDLWKS